MSKLRLRWTFLFAGLVQAIGMLVDAFQILRRAGGESMPGRPWVRLVEAAGLDPTSFGPLLLVLGVAWLAVTIAILRGSQRAFLPAVTVAVASLWYVVMGTGLAVIYLIALATMRGRDGNG